MQDLLAYELQSDAFVEAFKAVQHTLICRSIGDANVYSLPASTTTLWTEK